MPFKTQGNALRGLMSMFSSAIVVNTVAAVNSWPMRTYVPKVRMEIRTGVVAQK